MSDDAEAIRRLVRGLSPEHDEIHAEMAAYADEHGFPIVGLEAGGALRLLARLTDAAHVFEFGSGFGYSAYWFSKGAAPDAQFILTEYDADELDMAREFFERAGLSDRTEFHEGDAVAAVEEYDGPFDVVLVDHEKSRYAEAFRAVRSKVARGGVVVADNVTRGPADAAALARYVEGESLDAPDEHTKGVASYLDAVRADPEYETVLLPIGNGLAVSVRTGRTDADA
ncbi:class I SAM-dependent methyltransferase [Halopelagius fulvigenes]|uniref:Class I SAM-dependent methyltransferase n=1 Tax=Halopelagius fulvigenes TaxID=1198324 RepID=A0ABD5TYZ5_9EURY